MDISVIIVNYQREDNVLKCLNSLARADWGDLTREIIVVDNAASGELKQVAKNYPEVKKMYFIFSGSTSRALADSAMISLVTYFHFTSLPFTNIFRLSSSESLAAIILEGHPYSLEIVITGPGSLYRPSSS